MSVDTKKYGIKSVLIHQCRSIHIEESDTQHGTCRSI